MSTVDEIIASGRYTDRRGRGWVKHTYLHGSVEWLHFVTGGTYASRPAEMRLLIERDQHRGECPRVGVCQNHPVPRVTFCDVGGFDIWAAGELARAEFARPCIATLPEAMDAARALTVGA